MNVDKVKLLFFVPSNSYGGGEAYIFNLISYIKGAKSNCEVLVLTGCRLLESYLAELNVRVVYLNTSPQLGLRLMISISNLNYYISNFSPDAVFLNGLPEAGVYSRYIKFQNLICICHSNEYWLRESKFVSVKRLLKWLVIFNFDRYLKKLIVITDEAVKSTSFLRASGLTIEKIHNGISPIVLKKNQSFLKKDFVVFGRISRLCPGKGNENLIMAFSEYYEVHQNGYLFFAGEGEDFDSLNSLVESLGLQKNVVFLGHVKPIEFYSKIDCMVSPSDMEGLPTVIIEAMSCNVPIISTNVGGVSELINHLDTGYLVQPYSISELKEAMCFFSDNQDLFHSMAKKAYIKYLLEFSLNSFGEKTWRNIVEII